MKWVKKPTRPGWYWHRTNWGTEIVQVGLDMGKTLGVWSDKASMYDSLDVGLYSVGLWQGPLSPEED